ncbi:unnamed protein product [Protopolystoma xenopodis]|uniref:Uncharacterized protein n=1 Tax=Protopolystoma xenopodis TaxID=117903 RepID=A0A448XCP0_9PLAT|nr:unnamed protein product [Protopolystoma xenopodis]
MSIRVSVTASACSPVCLSICPPRSCPSYKSIQAVLPASAFCQSGFHSPLQSHTLLHPGLLEAHLRTHPSTSPIPTHPFYSTTTYSFTVGVAGPSVCSLATMGKVGAHKGNTNLESNHSGKQTNQDAGMYIFSVVLRICIFPVFVTTGMCLRPWFKGQQAVANVWLASYESRKRWRLDLGGAVRADEQVGSMTEPGRSHMLRQ